MSLLLLFGGSAPFPLPGAVNDIGYWPELSWPNPSLVQWYWPVYGTPPAVVAAWRVYVVESDSRTYAVASESRVYVVAADC